MNINELYQAILTIIPTNNSELSVAEKKTVPPCHHHLLLRFAQIRVEMEGNPMGFPNGKIVCKMLHPQ